MERDWLIRTKTNKIFGPVSKEKVRELYHNGTLSKDDELSTGNGYWFYIKEKTLLDKYLLGDMVQDFNPVTEADTVLSHQTLSLEEDYTDLSGDSLLPDDNDLAFPSFDDDEINQLEAERANSPRIDEELEAEFEDDLDFGEVDEVPDNVEEIKFGVQEKLETKSSLKKESKENNIDLDPPKYPEENPLSFEIPGIPKSFLSEKVLYTLFVILFIVAVLAFYFRKRIVREFMEDDIVVSLVSSAHAQSSGDKEKKNLI